MSLAEDPRSGLRDRLFRRPSGKQIQIVTPLVDAASVDSSSELGESEYMRRHREELDREMLEMDERQLLADIADGFVERVEAEIVPIVDDRLPGDLKAYDTISQNAKFKTKQGGAFIAYATLTDAPTQEERRLKDVSVIWEGPSDSYRDPSLLLYLLKRQQAALNSKQRAALFTATPWKCVLLEGIKVSLQESDPNRGKAKPLITGHGGFNGGLRFEKGVLDVDFFVAPELTAAFLDEIPSPESRRVYQARQELHARVMAPLGKSEA